MINTMNHKISGAVLIVSAFALYYFKPFDFGALDFLLGVITSIGLSLLLGWLKKIANLSMFFVLSIV